MADANMSAKDYVSNTRAQLLGGLRNLSVIAENLYQQGVLNDEEFNEIKAEKDDYGRTEAILDSVSRKGEAACYKLLRIIYLTRRRTLKRPTPLFKNGHEPSAGAKEFDLHHWISCFSFKEDPEMSSNYIQGPKVCHRYQTKLKTKAAKISKDFWRESKNLFGENKKPKLSFYPLILDTEGTTSPSKIKKFISKKSKMHRPSTKHKPKVSPSDLLKTDKNILLVGNPGIGKTALSHEMLRLWSKRDKKKLDYMFYFDMREITSNSPTMGLEDLLFTAYCQPDEGKDEVLQDIERTSDNVTIILDGVTALSSLVVQKVVKKDLLPDAKIIITCRPDDEEDLCLEDWLRVEVKGFSEETIKTYLSTTLGDDHREVLNNTQMVTLCHVPMYALMVAASFSSGDSLLPRTVNEIYISAVRHRLQLKGNKLLSLAKAAFYATQRKTVSLEELSCEDSCVLSFLKPHHVKVAPAETRTVYAFLHYTMQEFFAALWLLKNPNKIREVFQQCLAKEMKHMRPLIPFACCLLNEKRPRLMSCLIPAEELKETSEWFFKEMINTFSSDAAVGDSEPYIDIPFICQCLYESQSLEACIYFLDKLDFHLDLSGENLDPYSCCAVAYVITQSTERKIRLNLQDVVISDQELNQLLGCLQNVQWCDALGEKLWKTFLLSEERMDYSTLLGLCGNTLYLPVVGKRQLFHRAVEVMQKMTAKVNVCLYGDRKAPLCEVLCESLLQALPHIGSLSKNKLSLGLSVPLLLYNHHMSFCIPLLDAKPSSNVAIEIHTSHHVL
ncbi:protein NLRC5 [Fundulus heteroclitus]|uniref:protein NLRC5 n=1 Tax=Fundulus heteroclitus TaxID=8078 RepID=UPI00165C09E3|nr:protein NLRC5 [Fundulus heteroclitus]